MYSLRNSQIPLCEDYEVIVVGGGPAGCAAAISAAREGAKTLLLEASGMLGGMATKGLVCAWCPFSDKERVIYSGIAEHIFRRVQAAMPHVDESWVDWVPIDYEVLKTVYDEEVTGAGADILFHSMVCGVEKKDDRNIDTLIVASKSGLVAYRAGIYIDCTGDADLAYWAGNRMAESVGDGGYQPASLCFMISNVHEEYLDPPKDLYGANPDGVMMKIVADEEFDIPDTHLCYGLIGPNTMGFNAGHIWNVDPTDPESATKAILRGRNMARQFLNGFKKYLPEAFKDAFLAETAPSIGTRESRRIIGDYVFTVEDYLARRSFPDEIGRNNYYIDIHKSVSELAAMGETLLERYERYGKGESHGIPYRILCPADLDNLLVAGRTVSSDRITQGSLRVMPPCLVEGEAAGMAAAFCVADKKYNIHQVDTQKLRKRLTEEGAYLPKLPGDTF